MKFVLASKMMTHIPDPVDVSGTVAGKAAGWAANKAGEGISHVLDGVGQGILHGLVVGWHAMPMLLTVVGLGLFVLTMAAGNGKLYGWGCAAWAASAVIKVMISGG